jgi:hypothetical protein
MSSEYSEPRGSQASEITYSSLLHYVDELLMTEFSITVLIELIYHYLHLIIPYALFELSDNSSHLLQADLSAVIFVE